MVSFKKSLMRASLFCLLAWMSVACVREQPQIIVITATFPTGVDTSVQATQIASAILPEATPLPPLALSPVPMTLSFVPTPDRFISDVVMPSEYVVRPGDTLSLIAQRYGLSLNSILEVNEIINPNVLSVGQVLQLPDLPQTATPDIKIMADSRLVRSHQDFDVEVFIAKQPGYIRAISEMVANRNAEGREIQTQITAAQIVNRVSLEYSVDPRLLLAFLEYRSGWLSQPTPSEAQKIYPIIQLPNREGLYRQLAWLANELNRGYYGWKYRGLNSLELTDGKRFIFANGLNAATIALQYVLSIGNIEQIWLRDVQLEGFFATYYAYFGNPFENNRVDQPLPTGLQQPPLELPFAEGEVWYFTGGAHGGWGSGSAWAAIDFAPPDERTPTTPFCYTSEYPVRAVAPGVIARSGDGVVVLDLSGDGDESTGWTILYLHLNSDMLIAEGENVVTGTPIGYAACDGGFSNATHLHIARRYNGEWIPADCTNCREHLNPPPFVMSGWQVVALPGQEYQGFLTRNSEQRRATQGRDNPVNHISR